MCVYFLYGMFFPIKVATRSKREKLSQGVAGETWGYESTYFFGKDVKSTARHYVSIIK